MFGLTVDGRVGGWVVLVISTDRGMFGIQVADLFNLSSYDLIYVDIC